MLLAATAVALALAGCSSSGTGTGSRSAAVSVGSAGSASAHGTRTISVVEGGDDLPQDKIIAAAHSFSGGSGYDFKPIFAAIRPLVSGADLALCQMEGTLSPDDTHLTSDAVRSGVVHHGPREFARDLAWAGYDGCSTANNHTFDWGAPGLADTRNVLSAYGIKAAGPGPTAETPGQPAMYTVQGIKIAQLAYSYNLTNGSEYPADAPWLQANTLHSHTAAAIIADARAARTAGAQIVLVSMHWGRQFVVAPSAEQTSFAQALLTSGQVDQIIGNHPHVVQACRRINGRIANYALGNQVSDQHAGYPPANGTHPAALDDSQDGAIVKVTFTVKDGKVVSSTEQYQVTRTDIPAGFVIRLIDRASDGPAWTQTTKQLQGPENSCRLTPLA